ncbi:MAG: FISUMP domain-containing protein [bacterium]
MSRRNLQKKDAFTLVELIIVISVVSVLAAAVLIGINPLARFRAARNSRRASEAADIAKTLQLYQADHNGNYPPAVLSLTPNSFSMIGTGVVNCNQHCAVVSSATSCIDLSILASEGYIASIPISPPGDGVWSGALTGYAVEKTGNGLVSVVSCDEESGTVSPAATSTAVIGATPTASATPAFACGNSVVYSGKIYSTVAVGAQCWFASNLDAGLRVDTVNNQADAETGNFQKYCYNNDTGNCSTSGGLYQWHTLMAFPQSCDSGVSFSVNGNGTYSGMCGSYSATVAQPHQGICPADWHVSSDEEWASAESFFAAGSCSSSRLGIWDCVPAGTALLLGGVSNFNGRLSGSRHYLDGSTNWLGYFGYYWSSMPNSSAKAVFRHLSFASTGVYRDAYERGYGFSARCVHN